MPFAEHPIDEPEFRALANVLGVPARTIRLQDCRCSHDDFLASAPGEHLAMADAGAPTPPTPSRRRHSPSRNSGSAYQLRDPPRCPPGTPAITCVGPRRRLLPTFEVERHGGSSSGLCGGLALAPRSTRAGSWSPSTRVTASPSAVAGRLRRHDEAVAPEPLGARVAAIRGASQRWRSRLTGPGLIWTAAIARPGSATASGRESNRSQQSLEVPPCAAHRYARRRPPARESSAFARRDVARRVRTWSRVPARTCSERCPSLVARTAGASISRSRASERRLGSRVPASRPCRPARGRPRAEVVRARIRCVAPARPRVCSPIGACPRSAR